MDNETYRLLGHLLHVAEDTRITIERVQCQLQQGLDCGLHAIAMAVAFVYNRDPGMSRFDPHRMRSHLLSCLENQKLSTFPEPLSMHNIKTTKVINKTESIVIPKLWHQRIVIN